MLSIKNKNEFYNEKIKKIERSDLQTQRQLET